MDEMLIQKGVERTWLEHDQLRYESKMPVEAIELEDALIDAHRCDDFERVDMLLNRLELVEQKAKRRSR